MAKNNNEENNNKRRTYKQLKPVSLLSGVEEIRNDFEERLEQGTVNYGIEILDDYVNTIRKGSLTFILARPNVGKSLLGQQIACHLATQGKRVCICSCEMGSGLLMERQIRKTLGIGMGDLYTTYKNHRDMGNQLLDKLIEDDKYNYLRNIDVCETGGASVYDIIDMLECFTEYEYIVIDYIQRIKGGGSEYENITESARELQTYARRTGKPLIVCSQAKRQPTNEKFDPTNAGSAGKGSGSIEEDGDVGILLSELYEDGSKKILATLFKNRFEGGKNITYKYRLDNRLNMVLEQKDYDCVQ